MKRKIYLFLVLLFGLFMGWTLGYLRLPYLERDDSFWIGFIAALTAVSFVLMLSATWRGVLLSALTGRAKDNTNRGTLLWRGLAVAGLLGGLLGGIKVYYGNESLKKQIRDKDKTVHEMAELIEAVKNKSELAPLMQSMLNDVWEELKQAPGRTLLDTTIARIRALSFSFKPYKQVEGDTLSEREYSPERGQLLQALALMDMDSGSFAKIKQETPFAGADLRGANLRGRDLSGIDLKGANLKDADLSDARLIGAALEGASFWGANLERVNLSRANLKRADLRWARVNEGVLVGGDLSGADLSNAQLHQANLFDATIQWAKLSGAIFSEAKLTSVYFVGTDLSKANFTQANFSGTDLRKTNLSEADLVGAIFDKVMVENNWLNKVNTWRPLGEQELMERYYVANDTFDSWGRPLYRLIRK